MDLRELTKLAVKLAGLYVLVNAVIALVTALADPEAKMPAWFLGANALYMLLGAALFWFPGMVISRVVRLEGIEGPISPSRVMEVGFGLLGVYFAMEALYGFVYTIARVKLFYRFSNTFDVGKAPDFTPSDLAALVGSIVQIVVGLSLWLWRRKVATFEVGASRDR